jgi:3-oxoadipate enol-lactonase
LKPRCFTIPPAVRGMSYLLAAILIIAPNSVSAAPRPQSTPGDFLDVDGSKIYYQDCGTGPEAVLLIHDGIVHSEVWDGVWEAFCKEFHTIRYDRRGYGRSTPTTKWYTETDDILALLRLLKIKRTCLVGSSHGGALAIDFTLEHPGLVEGLVLVGAIVDGYGYSDHFLDRVMHNEKPMEKSDVAGLVSNWTNDKYVLAAGHEAARKKLHDLLAANPQDLTHDDLARRSPSALPRLHEIHAPTLILVGDADIPDVHSHAGVIETGIPNARRVVISDAGHLMYLEKPEEFSRVVIGFLQQNRE